MKTNAARFAAFLIVLAIGFCLGRMTNPPTVKAGKGPIVKSRIVHVRAKDSGDSLIPPPEGWVEGVDPGTPVSLSCTPSGDCYVLLNLQ
jgi:hypothetical protein